MLRSISRTILCVVVLTLTLPSPAIIHFYATGVAAGSSITPECAEEDMSSRTTWSSFLTRRSGRTS